MNKIIETVPFNFDDLFNECRKLFGDSGFDVSDGSNTSQLSAVMAYMISSLNTNTALNINETLLPYATKRKNILQDARVLGYEATHIKSFIYRLTVRLDNKMCGYGYFVLPKYTEFTSNGNTYYYLGVYDDSLAYTTADLKVNLGVLVHKGVRINPDDLTFYDINGDEITEGSERVNADRVMYKNNNVTSKWKQVVKTFLNNRNITFTIKEGELITYKDDTSLNRVIDSVQVNNNTYTRNYIDIPYTDVENDGIECIVSYYDINDVYQTNVIFEKTNDYFFESDGNKYVDKKFIRIDDIEMGTPRIYFKYSGVGKGLPLGSEVQLNILISKGTDGDVSTSYTNITKDNETMLSYSGISLPIIASDNTWISDVFDGSVIVSCDLVQSGTSEESTESIVENAPKIYNSAHRLITNLDFESACNRSPLVLDSVVWGGEDEFPKSPGHIWFSFLPDKTSKRTFTSDTNNTEFQRDNSKLVYNYAVGDTKYQYAIRQDFYQNNYILNTEILRYSIYKDSSGTHKKYAGIWGDIENMYVPGLTFHHRHPLYMDFNYTFNILKYNIKQTTSEVHKTLFDILNNCFHGNDLNLENFGVEYFQSNIVKRIDSEISDLCGFTCSLETKLMLNEKTCCMENWHPEYKDIYIPLAVPFEKYFTDDGFLDVSRLPNIDTEKFIDMKFGELTEYSDFNYCLVSGDLYVDFSSFMRDQNYRKTLTGDLDYTDKSAKLFLFPVKIKMKNQYSVRSINDSKINLGFKISPNNDTDESYNNITITLYNSNGDVKHKFSNYNGDLSFSEYFGIEWKDRNSLKCFNSFMALTSPDDYMVIEFTRTCGFYYLFNSFKKDILVHLFVNGEYEGFYEAYNGMRKNNYFDHYQEKLNEIYTEGEEFFNDETNYIDITYTTPRSYIFHSTPRSYLCTVDKHYLTSEEPIGIELEHEKHLFNHDQYGLPIANQDYDNPHLVYVYSTRDGDDRVDEENGDGHYLTTEGYLSDNTETSVYAGPIVRAYNENMYMYTPLTFDMFKQNVYLNVRYPSENFKLEKNVIPRLNHVTFKNAPEIY